MYPENDIDMDMDRLYNNNIIRRICSSICTQIHTHEAVHSTDLYGQIRENEIEMEREREHWTRMQRKTRLLTINKNILFCFFVFFFALLLLLLNFQTHNITFTTHTKNLCTQKWQKNFKYRYTKSVVISVILLRCTHLYNSQKYDEFDCNIIFFFTNSS